MCELSEPKRTTKYTPPLVLHWRCSSWFCRGGARISGFDNTGGRLQLCEWGVLPLDPDLILGGPLLAWRSWGGSPLEGWRVPRMAGLGNFPSEFRANSWASQLPEYRNERILVQALWNLRPWCVEECAWNFLRPFSLEIEGRKSSFFASLLKLIGRKFIRISLWGQKNSSDSWVSRKFQASIPHALFPLLSVQRISLVGWQQGAHQPWGGTDHARNLTCRKFKGQRDQGQTRPTALRGKWKNGILRRALSDRDPIRDLRTSQATVAPIPVAP